LNITENNRGNMLPKLEKLNNMYYYTNNINTAQHEPVLGRIHVECKPQYVEAMLTVNATPSVAIHSNIFKFQYNKPRMIPDNLEPLWLDTTIATVH
jgi:hypothetical protein